MKVRVYQRKDKVNRFSKHIGKFAVLAVRGDGKVCHKFFLTREEAETFAAGLAVDQGEEKEWVDLKRIK